MKLALATIGLLVLWTAIVGVGALEGWWHGSLAPAGDTDAMLAALVTEIENDAKGNVALAILEDGSVRGEHTFSVGEPVDRDSVFQVASLSKWVTAWGVMALVEAGRLDLDAPVARVLSRWSLPPSEFDNDAVTVRRLLSHTAGLTDGLGYAGFEPGAPVQTLEDSLTRAADPSPGASGAVRVGRPPGERFEYSGGGYTLLQLLVEEASGEPFEAFMQRTVFEPLGMRHTTFLWDESRGTRLATIYDVDSTPATHYRFTALAAASLYTSVSDLTTFMQAHLPGKEGERIGRGVLEPETLEQMREPQASQFGAEIWGLGTILHARAPGGGWVIGHDGNNAPAINTAVRLDPETGDGIVILETGNRLLATRLADEWLYWNTGNPGLLTFLIELPSTFRAVAGGWLAILLSAGLVAWQRRRARSD